MLVVGHNLLITMVSITFLSSTLFLVDLLLMTLLYFDKFSGTAWIMFAMICSNLFLVTEKKIFLYLRVGMKVAKFLITWVNELGRYF